MWESATKFAFQNEVIILDIKKTYIQSYSEYKESYTHNLTVNIRSYTHTQSYSEYKESHTHNLTVNIRSYTYTQSYSEYKELYTHTILQ